MNEVRATFDTTGGTRQIAALPWRIGRSIEILLVSSRETRRWVLPKGWRMKGKTGSQSAAAEALEEAGIEGIVAEAPVGEYFYKKRLKNGAVLEVQVEVFPLLVTHQRKNWREKDQRKTRWTSIQQAAAGVGEPELKTLILQFGEDMLQQVQQAQLAAG